MQSSIPTFAEGTCHDLPEAHGDYMRALCHEYGFRVLSRSLATSNELWSELLKGDFMGDYIGEYFRGC